MAKRLLLLALAVTIVAASSAPGWCQDPGPEWQLQSSGTIEWLWGVWANSPTQAWAVGSFGTALSGNGTSWVATPTNVTATLCDVWGFSNDDVFAVGTAGTIIRWDGFQWKEMASGTTEDLFGVWGDDNEDVWAVGANGTLLHYTETVTDRRVLEWVPVASGTSDGLFDVWGANKKDIFAVGVGGQVIRYDGEEWQLSNTGTTENLSGVWGVSEEDVYAVGDAGVIRRFDGTSWSAVASGLQTNLYSVWGEVKKKSNGNVSGVVFIVGQGGVVLGGLESAFAPVSSPTQSDLFAVFTIDDDEAYAVGRTGTIVRYFEPKKESQRLGKVRRLQIQPNPFNPTATIRFESPIGEPASVTIFDVSGRQIAKVFEGVTSAEVTSVTWTGRDGAGNAVTSGIYFSVVRVGEDVVTRKMVLLK